MSEATLEAMWLKVFSCELGEMASDEAVKNYEDNQSSIALAKNPESTIASSTSTYDTILCATGNKTDKCDEIMFG